MYQKWQDVWQYRRLPLIFGTLYFILSLFAMAHFLNSSFLGDRYFKTNFDGMYDGTTYKPFVYRQLVPMLARSLTAVSPEGLKASVNQSIADMKYDPELQVWRVTFPWMVRAFPTEDRHYERIMTILVIYASLWGYIWALRQLARHLFPISSAMMWFTPVFGILLISSYSFPFQYIYDIPVLFLSTACYLFIHQKRWTAYLVFFALACLNKETAIFIFMFFALWYFGRLERGTYINLLIVQYLIYAGIRLLLLYIYQDNTGEYLKNHLFRVLPGDIFTRSRYDRILMVAWMFFLLAYQWQKKPAFLKTSLWLLPPMYVAYLLYGMPEEYRVFFDILPLPLLLGVHTLVECTGVSRSPVFMHTASQPPPATGESIYESGH